MKLWKSRSERRSENNLGVINLTSDEDSGKYRSLRLCKLDKYYDNTQYDHLVNWEDGSSKEGYVPVRKRKPRLKTAFAKTLCQRVASKLVGLDTWPDFKVPEFPDDQAFIKMIVSTSKLQSKILEPVRRMLSTGSSFVKFYIIDGSWKIEWYPSKYCYPEFQPNGELDKIEIKYVYEDIEDLDDSGKPKKKWFRIELNQNSEIKYDNPDYIAGQKPEFVEVARVEHNLGFVQGEWLKTCDVPNSVDGYSITEDLTDFIDEINYSLSQSSQSVSYNQDPNVYFSGMTEEETSMLVRSAEKSWNLGREGTVGALETNLGGVERAIELRDKIRLNIQDISRVVLLDPDKIVGSAQSAKAMEVLHGPLKDLVDELRPVMEETLKKLILKMALALLSAKEQGIDIPIVIPEGYVPSGLASIECDWKPMFQETVEDLQKKVALIVAVTTANIISRETGLKYIAKDFGVADVDEEVAKIAAQPIFNPFAGGF